LIPDFKSVQPVRDLGLKFNLEKLRSAAEVALRRFPFSAEYLQLALTHSAQATTPEQRAYDGLGSLYDFEKHVYKRDPAEFVHFNPAFADLYFFEVYKAVVAWSPLHIGRVRLMLRRPSSCYSMHKDESERYHLAIQSNADCYVLFKDVGIYQIPADGNLYQLEGRWPHTAFNAGKDDRIHLVFDTIEWRYKRAESQPVSQGAGSSV
jgi:hypothetical protein